MIAIMNIDIKFFNYHLLAFFFTTFVARTPSIASFGTFFPSYCILKLWYHLITFRHLISFKIAFESQNKIKVITRHTGLPSLDIYYRFFAHSNITSELLQGNFYPFVDGHLIYQITLVK